MSAHWLDRAREPDVEELADKALDDDQAAYPELWSASSAIYSASEIAFLRGFLAGATQGMELAARLLREIGGPS